MGAVRPLGLVLLAIAVLATAVPAGAAEWDSIVPGKSTFETVRARFGEPGARKTQKIEGYDTTEWVYESDRAPKGIRRLTIGFGILLPGGYKPDTVRTFRLDPSPGVFSELTIRNGWGVPSAIGREGEFPSAFYEEGLLVIYERDSNRVRQMIFMMPQKPK